MRISDWSSDVCSSELLTDDEQFLRPRRDQLFGLAQHRVDTAADQFAAQIRDDAEGTAMVAALRNLQIAVVARGELQPAPVVPKTGNQIDERTLRRRRGVVNGVDDLLILMRAGDGEHVGEAGADDVGFAADRKSTRLNSSH